MISLPSESNCVSETLCYRLLLPPFQEVEREIGLASLSDSEPMSEELAPSSDPGYMLKDEFEVEPVLCCESRIDGGLERRERGRSDRRDGGRLLSLEGVVDPWK